MNYLIRRLGMSEIDEALSLVWEVFLEFEAPDYPEEGIRTFETTIIKSVDFKNRILSGDQLMYGTFHDKKLIGVLSISISNHISLLFVNKDYHRKGVATSLFKNLLNELKKNEVKKITLHSSPYGVPFYYKIGFKDVAAEQVRDGMSYTPMEYLV